MVRAGHVPGQGEAHPRREQADDAARRCHDEQRWRDGRSATERACAEGETTRLMPECVEEAEGRPWLQEIKGLPTGYEELGGAGVGEEEEEAPPMVEMGKKERVRVVRAGGCS